MMTIGEVSYSNIYDKHRQVMFSMSGARDGWIRHYPLNIDLDMDIVQTVAALRQLADEMEKIHIIDQED